MTHPWEDPLVAFLKNTVLALPLVLAVACQSKATESHQAPASAPPARASGIAHVNPHFRISLPPGWKMEASRPEPSESLGVYSDGVIALKAVGPDGYYVDVWFECPATEIFPDSTWKAVSDESGRSIDHFVEDDASCTQEGAKACVKRYEDDPHALGPGPEYCHCSVGDGRLDVWANFEGKRPFRTPNGMCFHVGNISREDANRAPLRDILRTFHLEGAIDAPAPPLPLPGAMQKALDASAQHAREASTPRYAEYVSCSPERTLEERPGLLGHWPPGTAVRFLSRTDDRSVSITTVAQTGTRTGVWGDCTMLAAAPAGDSWNWLGMVGVEPGTPYHSYQPKQIEAQGLAPLAARVARSGDLERVAAGFKGARLLEPSDGAVGPLSAAVYRVPGAILITAVRFPVLVNGLPAAVPGPVVVLLDGETRLTSGPCSTDPFVFSLGGRTYLFVLEQICASGYGMRRLFAVESGQLRLLQESDAGSL